MNGEKPNESIPVIRRHSGFISLKRRAKVLLPKKKKSIIHKKDINWEITVARLAPTTPILNTKMNRGSNAILITAPIKTENIAVSDLPCAVINGFRP